MRHDEPAGAPHRGLDEAGVQRRQAAQVDHLDLDALLGRHLGGLQGGLHERAVGHERGVPALAQDAGGAHRGDRDVQVHVALVVVATLGLEVDHRVLRGDRGADEVVPLLWGGRGDHAQARGVQEVGLGRLGVVLRGADAAAEGDADGHRHRHGAAGAGAQLGQVRHDLVERRVHEAVELDLDDGPVAAHGQADGRAHDAGLGQRGVEHPVLAELGLQAVGDAEHAAEGADVLAHEQDLGVVGQGTVQAAVDRPAEGHALAHAPASSSSNCCR